MKRVGFIGLGNMGRHMAVNVHRAGYQLSVFDVNPDALASLPQQVSVANSPKQLAEQNDIVITMLPSSNDVKKVYLDQNTGILAGVSADSFLIDSSTIAPEVSIEVSAIANSRGARMIDAPVSGGVGGAENASLTFMVGAKQAEYEEALNVLQTMGKTIAHCGPAGTGQTAKLVNNLILGISMTGVSEAMNLGIKLGIDPKVLAGIVNTSSGRCWSSDTYNPVPGVMEGVPSSRGYTGGFGCALMLKDLGLARESAERLGVSTPLADLVHGMYDDIVKSGEGAKDFSVVYDVYKKTS